MPDAVHRRSNGYVHIVHDERPVHAALPTSLPPLHPQPLREDLVVDPLATSQDDPRAPREVRCRPRSMRQRIQLHAFAVRQNLRDLGSSQSHTGSL
jgi:hypothetical protein